MQPDPFKHTTPWGPAPTRTSARSYAQWLASAIGKGAAFIASNLVRLFYYTAQLAGRVANNAVTFSERLQRLTAGPAAGKIERGNIPRNDQIPEAYRAIVIIRFRDPAAPSGSRDPKYSKHMTVVVEFGHNPTKSEIIAGAKGAAVATSVTGSPKAQEVVAWNPVGFDIVGLERRT